MKKDSLLFVSLASTILMSGCAGAGGLSFVDLSAPYSEVDRNNPEVWIDNQTGLMWSKCPLGLKVNKRSRSDSVEALCVNDPNASTANFTWDEANEAIKKSKLAGYNDWRMPTYDEYMTLSRLSVSRRLSPTNVASSCPNELFLLNHKNAGKFFYWSSTRGTDRDDKTYGKDTYKGFAFNVQDNKYQICYSPRPGRQYGNAYLYPKDESMPVSFVRGPNILQK